MGVDRVSCYLVNVRIIFVNGLLLLRGPLVVQGGKTYAPDALLQQARSQANKKP